MSEQSSNRRLTTILAADVVSYSKHMAENEEATLQNLKRHMAVIEPLVAAQNGRIFYTTGDGFIAEYRSTLEAVRSAIEIQEAVALTNDAPDINPALYFRIGINVGDVIDEGGNLFGDGVNIAARLEGLAEAGGICVSSGVYELVKNKLAYQFTDMGEQRVKNIPTPVSTFALKPVAVNVETETTSVSAVYSRGWKRHYLYPAIAVCALALSVFALLNSTQESEPVIKPAKTQSAAIVPQTRVPPKTSVPNPFAGKWIVGTDNKKTRVLIELMRDGQARFVVQHLKNKKSNPAEKLGHWYNQSDNTLCIKLPSGKDDNCFSLRGVSVDSTGTTTYLQSDRNTGMSWELVDQP